MKKQNSRRVVRELQHIRTQLQHIRTQLRTGKTRGTKGRSLEPHELAFLRVRELELVEKRGLAQKRKHEEMTLVAKQILAESPEKLAASPEEAVEARQLAGLVRARADAADADAEHQLMVAVPTPSRWRKTHNGTTIDEARVPEMGRDPQVPAESNVLETFGRAPSALCRPLVSVLAPTSPGRTSHPHPRRSRSSRRHRFYRSRRRPSALTVAIASTLQARRRGRRDCRRLRLR